jgi:hypothetical protein
MSFGGLEPVSINELLNSLLSMSINDYIFWYISTFIFVTLLVKIIKTNFELFPNYIVFNRTAVLGVCILYIVGLMNSFISQLTNIHNPLNILAYLLVLISFYIGIRVVELTYKKIVENNYKKVAKKMKKEREEVNNDASKKVYESKENILGHTNKHFKGQEMVLKNFIVSILVILVFVNEALRFEYYNLLIVIATILFIVIYASNVWKSRPKTIGTTGTSLIEVVKEK